MPKFWRKAEIERGQRSLSSNLKGYSMKPKLAERRKEMGVHDHRQEASGDGVEAERRDTDEHSTNVSENPSRRTLDPSEGTK